MRSIWLSASAAPRAPSCFSASILSRRARTSEYSAATKNAFIRTSAGTASRRTAIILRPSPVSYFEEVRRRSSADASQASNETYRPQTAQVAASGKRIDLRRELEVVLGDAALGVRAEREVDGVPRDRDVGVG